MKKLTIRDISRLAGVSHSTVSRVLNGSPDVNRETRDKIQEIIKEYNYVPNTSARNLKLNDTKSIGVFSMDINNPLFTKMIQIIEVSLADLGYAMILQQGGSQTSGVVQANTLINEKNLNGLIFLGGLPQFNLDDIKNINIPYVFTTISPFNKDGQELYSSVSIDDKKAAFEAVDYLCSLGHKRIAIMNTLDVGKVVGIGEQRYQGYCEALRKNNIEIDEKLVWRMVDGFSMDSAYKVIKKSIENKIDYSAIFAVGDTIAFGACRALRDFGLQVPQDVSVMGFDGIDLAKFYIPSLCTMQQPIEEMSHSSVDILINIIEKKGQTVHKKFDASLVLGESCVPYKG